MRSSLVLNRSFVDALVSARRPSCALGLIEEHQQTYGLVALHPHESIPQAISAKGFELDHRVLGGDGFEVVQLTLEFRGFELGADGDVQVFRSEVGQETLFWLQAFLPRLIASRTSAERYAKSLAAFCHDPSPLGRVLDWACGDDMCRLDLSADRVELTPR